MRIQDNGTPVAVQGTVNFTNAASISVDTDNARIDVEFPGAGEGGGVTMSQVYPVGSIYLSVVSTNPGTLLGVGTWSAIAAGRMLVGFKSDDTDFDTVEETGGSKTSSAILAHTHGITDPGHNHTQDSHNHTQDAHTHIQNAHTHIQDAHQHGMAEGTTDGSGNLADRSNASAAASMVTDLATAVNQNATAVNQNATATNQAATATNQSNTTGITATDSAGSGSSFSIMNPYYTVYMWKRTA